MILAVDQVTNDPGGPSFGELMTHNQEATMLPPRVSPRMRRLIGSRGFGSLVGWSAGVGVLVIFVMGFDTQRYVPVDAIDAANNTALIVALPAAMVLGALLSLLGVGRTESDKV